MNDEELHYLHNLCKTIGDQCGWRVRFRRMHHEIELISRVDTHEEAVVRVQWNPRMSQFEVRVCNFMYANEAECSLVPFSMTLHGQIVRQVELAVGKARRMHAVRLPVIARGSFSFDPVPGESDYVG